MDLLDELADSICRTKVERGELTMVVFFFKKLHPMRCMDHVVEHVLPRKRHIEKRNDKFFDENKYSIFAGMPDDRIEYYAGLLKNKNRVSQDNLSVIWDYFDTMLALAEQYKKNK
jgi:hypothetical protein